MKCIRITAGLYYAVRLVSERPKVDGRKLPAEVDHDRSQVRVWRGVPAGAERRAVVAHAARRARAELLAPHAGAASRPRTFLLFDMHPWRYMVRVCPGPLARDGVGAAALTHKRVIYLAGDMEPGARWDALLDQLSRLREKHHGRLDRRGVAGFTADVMRQMLAQGGEPALKRLRPVGADVPAEKRAAA